MQKYHVKSEKAKSFDKTVAYTKVIVDKYDGESYALDCQLYDKLAILQHTHVEQAIVAILATKKK